MADEYKASAHWQALNRIWKALSPAAREAVKDDFRLLTDMIKTRGVGEEKTPAPPVKTEYDFENRYLEGMSKATKAYALKSLTQAHVDAYKKVADFITANKIRDMDVLWEKYALENEIDSADQPAMREIMCFCLERARRQGLV